MNQESYRIVARDEVMHVRKTYLKGLNVVQKPSMPKFYCVTTGSSASTDVVSNLLRFKESRAACCKEFEDE